MLLEAANHVQRISNLGYRMQIRSGFILTLITNAAPDRILIGNIN